MNDFPKKYRRNIFSFFLFTCLFYYQFIFGQDDNQNTRPELIKLFNEWRNFERPPFVDGVPDYSKSAFKNKEAPFQFLKSRLESMPKETWTNSEQVDWHILWAEMNGYLFNDKILKPWERDPAFYKSIWTYKSDVPAHEGPTHHAIIELWQFKFPLDKSSQKKLTSSLGIIPKLNQSAKINLTGNAKDLWIAGIRDIQNQSKVLSELLSNPSAENNKALKKAINNAKKSTDEFVNWLKLKAPSKNGPSGIGKENYTWYQQNVHLIPLSWEDEVILLKRELARAWSSLKLEEHRNRNLPKLIPVDSKETYNEIVKKGASELIDFLEYNDIVTVKPYFSKALEPHLGKFIPAEKRNFFWITVHLDPKPLFSHFYHWFELERMIEEPNTNPLREKALLYNIFDSRNEGLATAVEEIFMQAGLYDKNPRSREIVYILIAQRAARGLGSLYAHANMMTMEEAGKIHSEYTPRGWMKTEKDLLIFEQHLYLRQPGYGTSYITGKYLIESMMMEAAKQNEEKFFVKQFFDSMNAIGNIPVSLAKWEMTGDSSQIDKIKKTNSELEY